MRHVAKKEMRLGLAGWSRRLAEAERLQLLANAERLMTKAAQGCAASPHAAA